MKKKLRVVKAVIVNGIETLPEKFIDDYYPEVDMYIFFSESLFDTQTWRFNGKLLIHDRLIANLNLPYIPDNKINYITVDFRSDDKEHTYLTANSRYYKMTRPQLDFLIDMFDVDFCKKQSTYL